MSDRVDAQMLADWRINYNLVGRTPAEAMRWWHDHMDGKAPAGAVAALGLCIDEIERLTAERDKATYHLRNLLAVIHEDKGSYTATYGIEASVQDAFKRVGALRRQLAEAEQDAERYRWLRRMRRNKWRLMRFNDANGLWYDPIREELDAAIDAAMGASNE